MKRSVGDTAGIIVLDSRGCVGIVHGTPFMPHAYAGSGYPDIVAAMGTSL
jgi:uncharacterized protein (UPF0210 family)